MPTNQYRPMLAAKAELDKLQYPMLASPKLDGVRAIIKGGKVLSRSLKLIPNQRAQLQFGNEEYEGYDGELIVGNPWSKTVYNDTIREVMTIEAPCTADFYVFDRHDLVGTYLQRQAHLKAISRVYVLEQRYINNEAELNAYEQQQIDIGYEGVILRNPNAPYKYGRSTLKEGALIKLKRFEDSEAGIVGMEELMHNGNEALVSELGLTKRQTLQENQVGMDTMGALLVRDIHTGVEFKIGTGFTAQQRREFWEKNSAYYGLIVKYKYFPVGVKLKPRHPVYIGLRNKLDL